MRTSEKAFATLAVILTTLSMAACGQQGDSKPAGGFAKPGETAEILSQCAAQRLSSMATVFGETKKVCRVGADGKVQVKDINPNYYAGSGAVASRSAAGAVRHNIRLVQVISTQVTTSIPEAKVKEIESTVNQYLTQTCAPMMRQVMKRSNVTARFVFQAARPDDELAKPNVALANTASVFGDSTTVLDNGSAPETGNLPKTDEEKKQAALADPSANKSKDAKATPKVTALPTARGTTRTRQYELSSAINNPNLILELVYGADHGVTIKDQVKPVSSGALEVQTAGTTAVATPAQQAFCAQLMTYVGENLGLGGLAKGETCAVDAVAETTSESTKDSAKDAAKDSTKAAAKDIAKPVTGNPNIGLMKFSKVENADFSKLKLENQEVLDILKPVCGEIETAVKLQQKNKK